MKARAYSYSLVTLQFMLITALLIQHGLQLPSMMSLLLFCSGCGFGLYTMQDNTLGNFNISPEIKDNALLITTGAYRHIRHPMYFSVLLMMLGVLASRFNLLSLLLYLLLILTLLLKAKREEKLWVRHSNAYGPYRQKTKRIIPFIL